MVQLSGKKRPRLLRAAGLAVFTVVLSAATVFASSDSALAATCRTRGHAYLTQPGFVYFSGYEGDQSLGIPRTTAVRNFSSFRFGGNGIKPGTSITFRARNLLTGSPINVVTGQATLTTRAAGSNCVVNESAAFPVVAPSGLYRISASYTAGNTNLGILSDPVVDVEVF